MKQYGFSAKVSDIQYCRKRNYIRPIDEVEEWFYFVVKGILFLNIFGTIYDLIHKGGKGEFFYLINFIFTWF